ncbi:MAG: RNA polymerase sigma factor [Planctomycetota bacterium]
MGRRAERQNLRRLRERRREACEQLICQHYRSIYRFMAYLTRDVSLAEELTQETFASAWAGIDRFTGRAAFGTWLHQIAYRKFIDSRRRLQRDAALMAAWKESRNDAQETFDPLYQLTADENLSLLYEAMCKLESPEYAVIVLHYIQGLSFRQVAEVMGEPAGTVKWRTSRALKKLRQYLTGRVLQ